MSRENVFVGLFIAVMMAAIPGDSAQGAKPGSGGPKPITVSEFRTLEFADVAGSSEGSGTATIDTSGNKSTTGYAIDMGGNSRAAEYKITGDAGAVVVITLPTTAQITNGSTNITLSNFTSSPSGTATLDNKGKVTIYVGATMSVPANLSSGNYTGSFTVYVDPQ